MAFPTYDSMMTVLKTANVAYADFIADLQAQMADADSIKNGARWDVTKGRFTFAFHVKGQLLPKDASSLRDDLLKDGYTLVAYDQMMGFMPSTKLVDYTNTDWLTTGAEGYPTFPWTYVCIAKAN